MPQIATIQPASPQAPPLGPPPSKDTQQFSPHLDKAIAGIKDQRPSRENTDNRDTAMEKDETISNTQAENSVQSNNIVFMLALNQSSVQTVDTLQADKPAIQVLGQHLDNDSPLFEFLSKIFTVSDENSSSKPLASFQQSGQTFALGDLFKTPVTAAIDFKIDKNESLPSASAIESPGVKLENPLLLQLQKIIADSNESGKLSITVTSDTLKVHSGINELHTIAPTATLENEALPQAIIPVNFTEIPVEKPGQNLTSLRHSILQQYLEGKIDQKNDQESELPSANDQQGNSFSPKNSPNAEGNLGIAAGPDQTCTFAQPSALLQEGQKLPTTEASKPVTLPSGTVIQQEEVIRQIAERFQISRRDLDTRVNIQLHPAELGELKIDLAVKNGLVRANVVASSQYTQEIIEKNMVKLRTILENQGFTIGEITVTSKSDTAGDFNLSDRQHFSQDDYTPPSAKNTRNPGELFTLEDPTAREQSAMTSVNVKI